ncbi:MAG TPA: glycosyltransferase family 4 protein [Anaeromyxobacter sp.]|nr:glycosyltransferase family 4 protein [Anaeromyxobacter sp.]
MKIALVGNWPRPYGGVSVHVAALARALRTLGIDVRVLDIGEGDHECEGVVPARGVLRYASALAAVAAEGRLVHLHTNGANVKSWLVALAAGRARHPRAPRGVLTLHSGSAPAFLRGGAERRRLAAAACAGFGRVIAVNDEIAAELFAAGVPANRVSVLPPFSPAVLERVDPPAAFTAFRAAHAPVLAAALLPLPLYGADLLLEAFAALRRRHPRAGLALFGQGTQAPELRAPGVLGLGEIAHGEALGVLEASDVFVRPTRADGDSVSVREALALGCRVVASDVGHRPPGCELFPAGDGSALAAVLEVAAAGARPGPRAPPEDPFDAIVEAYRSLAAGRPAGHRSGGCAPAERLRR